MTQAKPIELEALTGTVVRFADEAGVEVPWSRAIRAVLAPWARRNGSE